jgi:hypothetical protein
MRRYAANGDANQISSSSRSFGSMEADMRTLWFGMLLIGFCFAGTETGVLAQKMIIRKETGASGTYGGIMPLGPSEGFDSPPVQQYIPQQRLLLTPLIDSPANIPYGNRVAPGELRHTDLGLVGHFFPPTWILMSGSSPDPSFIK